MGKLVFVSYSRRDASTVDTLVGDLRQLGHDPWVDRQLVGGQVWWDEVLRHIERCDVFLVAVSPDQANSAACNAEYAYANALGKPMLPVTVAPGVADEFLPQGIGMVQRIDYTAQDKQAFAALLGGLSALPAAPPLPAAMPPRPAVPATYLFDLKQEIDSDAQMTGEKQAQLIHQLGVRLKDGTDPAAMAELLDRFGRRDDLLVRTAQQIGEMRAGLPAAGTGLRPPADTPAAPPLPVAPAVSPAMGRSDTPPPPPPPRPSYAPQPAGYAPLPPGAQQESVPGTWWLLPILLGFLGGLIAWALLKQRAPSKSKAMLVVGIVVSLVGYAIIASQGTQ